MLVNLKYTDRNVSHVTPGQWSVTDCKLAKYGWSHTRGQETGRSTNMGVTAVGCLHLSCRHAEDADSSPLVWLIDPELICQRLEEVEHMNPKAVRRTHVKGHSSAEPSERSLTYLRRGDETLTWSEPTVCLSWNRYHSTIACHLNNKNMCNHHLWYHIWGFFSAFQAGQKNAIWMCFEWQHKHWKSPKYWNLSDMKRPMLTSDSSYSSLKMLE